ncbi:MAG: Lrp/AsnC family transcriptional regulator, partial [Thermoplasmata archaeon]|nr:Lrp/AsnC family transcriptional regulator [Thermoplasmata archaeon]
VSENISTLEAIVNFHIRSHPTTNDVDFNIIISSEKDFIVPTVLTPELKKTPPCGMLTNCRDCDSFRKEKCMGCPVTGQYQGWCY